MLFPEDFSLLSAANATCQKKTMGAGPNALYTLREATDETSTWRAEGVRRPVTRHSLDHPLAVYASTWYILTQ